MNEFIEVTLSDKTLPEYRLKILVKKKYIQHVIDAGNCRELYMLNGKVSVSETYKEIKELIRENN